MPTDPLTARPLFLRYFDEQGLDAKETIVVAPDMGRANAASRFAARLGLGFAAAEKKRMSDAKVQINRSIVRQLKGYNRALIYDDEIATGGSVIELSKILIHAGISNIALICTHGVFTSNALDRLSTIHQIKEIVTTNTVPIPKEHRPEHLKVLSVGSVFGEAILRNFLHQSIGDLYTFSEEQYA